MKTYEVKTGRGVERWQSPYDYIVPQPGNRGLCGAFSSIDEALDNPIASPSLEELARNAKKIAVAVPDMTRGWCRASDMNVRVRERIAAATKSPVTWIVGTGQHRAVEAGEEEFLFGDALKAGDRWISHDCDSAVATGQTTPLGTPVTLDPAFIEADLVVLVGGITFHDMAGFSGGRKMIIPGVSGRGSIIANHNHCLLDGDLNPLADCGVVDVNPMAQDQRAYADLALTGKKCFILNTISDDRGEPAAWVAGDIWAAWKVGCDACRSLGTIYVPKKASRCVSSCGGYPFDMDLYQGSKALSSCLAALEPNAPIVLVASLEECVGPEDFADATLRAMADARGFFKFVERDFTVGRYMALRMVVEMKKRPAAIVTPRSDVPFPGKVFRTMSAADRWLQEISGLDGLSILVPSGNAIHVATKQG